MSRQTRGLKRNYAGYLDSEEEESPVDKLDRQLREEDAMDLEEVYKPEDSTEDDDDDDDEGEEEFDEDLGGHKNEKNKKVTKAKKVEKVIPSFTNPKKFQPFKPPMKTTMLDEITRNFNKSRNDIKSQKKAVTFKLSSTTGSTPVSNTTPGTSASSGPGPGTSAASFDPIPGTSAASFDPIPGTPASSGPGTSDSSARSARSASSAPRRSKSKNERQKCRDLLSLLTEARDQMEQEEMPFSVLSISGLLETCVNDGIIPKGKQYGWTNEKDKARLLKQNIQELLEQKRTGEPLNTAFLIPDTVDEMNQILSEVIDIDDKFKVNADKKKQITKPSLVGHKAGKCWTGTRLEHKDRNDRQGNILRATATHLLGPTDVDENKENEVRNMMRQVSDDDDDEEDAANLAVACGDKTRSGGPRIKRHQQLREESELTRKQAKESSDAKLRQGQQLIKAMDKMASFAEAESKKTNIVLKHPGKPFGTIIRLLTMEDFKTKIAEYLDGEEIGQIDITKLGVLRQFNSDFPSQVTDVSQLESAGDIEVELKKFEGKYFIYLRK